MKPVGEGEITTQLSHALSVISATLHSLPFLRLADTQGTTVQFYDQAHLRRLLWYLLGGARGGPNRAQIIKAIQDRPQNANQLAETLNVDYKTILHHLRILKENGLVVASDEKAYGAVLFLTPKMEAALPIMEEIWSKIGRKNISPRSKE